MHCKKIVGKILGKKPKMDIKSRNSIIQEYEQIKRSLTPEQNNKIEKFLKENPQYLLSDVYYNEDVWNKVFSR